MSKVKIKFSVLVMIMALVLASGPEKIQAQHEHHLKTDEQNIPEKTKQKDDSNKQSMEKPVPPKTVEPEKLPQTSSISLAELERMALEKNPTLKQAEFSIRAAEGRKIQAALFPNPIVGFSAEDLSFRNFGDGGKVSFFIEQQIPLGGKLSKSRRVFEQDINLTEAARRTQHIRVLNSVRLLYAEALGAQDVADLKKELTRLAEESVNVSGELYNVGLADRPDQLKAEISRTRAEAEYFEARNKYEEVWQKLGAMIGSPEMQPVRLSGNLTDLPGVIDPQELLANLLKESPEIKAAQVKVERARLALRRARAEKVPDLYLRGGVGYNNELIEESPVRRRVGAEGLLEIGVTLPIFNRNQGGIKTAEAELAITEREVERLQLTLRTRFAEVLRNYRTSVFLADRSLARIGNPAGNGRRPVYEPAARRAGRNVRI
jgi:cobalt-zinc-cadmium efflux system outer membrane protein